MTFIIKKRHLLISILIISRDRSANDSLLLLLLFCSIEFEESP